MAVELTERHDGKVVIVFVTGKLSKDDYQVFTPELERVIRQFGKIRVLVKMLDFRGWDAGALWEDIKFDAKHFADIERLALVGDKQWEKGMSVFCKPFTTAEVRYFDLAQAEEASEWIEAGIEVPVQPS
jgi:hypothetical protein